MFSASPSAATVCLSSPRLHAVCSHQVSKTTTVQHHDRPSPASPARFCSQLDTACDGQRNSNHQPDTHPPPPRFVSTVLLLYARYRYSSTVFAPTALIGRSPAGGHHGRHHHHHYHHHGGFTDLAIILIPGPQASK
ncbi:hypothetical protein PVAG01_07888 [Phlyctema vagabunda]|uniref:Secreted protein n=1 Tax=Phlyctema vagabunda TaxID=108571 RepID=A0ABR4PDP6_9HELO